MVFFSITGELEISLLEATNYRMVQQGAHSICYWWAMQCNYFSDMHISSSSMPFIVMYSLNLHNFSVFLVSTEWPRKKKGQNRHFGPSILLQRSIWSLNFQKDQFDPSIFVFRSSLSLYWCNAQYHETNAKKSSLPMVISSPSQFAC